MALPKKEVGLFLIPLGLIKPDVPNTEANPVSDIT